MKAQIEKVIRALKICFSDYCNHFKLLTLGAIVLVTPGLLSSIQQWCCGVSSSTFNILLTIALALLQNVGNVFYFVIAITKKFDLAECLKATKRVFTPHQTLVLLSIELINFSLVFYGMSTQCPANAYGPCTHWGFFGIYSFALVILSLGYLKNFFILSAMEKERWITTNWRNGLKVFAAVWFVPPLITLISTGLFNFIPWSNDFILDTALTIPLMYPLSNLFMAALYKEFAPKN